MILKLTNWILSTALIGTIFSILVITSGYVLLKPNLPEINLVDQNVLQIPLKVFTQDGELIGEFGDQKRRTIAFEQIPENLKNAFLAAEDDQFFEHEGVRILAFVRALYQMIKSGEIVSGGGTITMQVVRGYLLTREQKIIRKIKEIYLAFELESFATKEEIFSLYLNTIFLGNRSYGVEAAANKYFSKSVEDLTLAESALIASSAQLPSRINPIRSPERSIVRRNWILGRMYKLGYIGRAQYLISKNEPIQLSQNDSSYEIDGRYISEIVRQQMIERFGLTVYKDGLSVFTTIDSKLQKAALASVAKNLYEYDKRHGWRKPKNFLDEIPDNIFKELQNGNLEILYSASTELDELGMEQFNISLFRDYFDSGPLIDSHASGIVIDIKPKRIIYLSDDFKLENLEWDDSYKWAREHINIDKLGPIPQNFYDILDLGDFIHLSQINNKTYLDQVPVAETAFISSNPNTGAVKAYIGGLDFSKSNFDRVTQSFPQAGSSFKPFIYASAFASGYKASDLINDAPIIFDDSNLESVWRPENYTGKFYGLIRLREALVQSVNLVSIKLLREMGIPATQNFLSSFGFKVSRLAPDLSMALGSSSFSPAEMTRAYNILVNPEKGKNLYFIEKILNRNNEILFSHQALKTNQETIKNIDAFPWFKTQLSDQDRPFLLLRPLNDQVASLDPRAAYITKDILKEALSRGSNGRKTNILNRSDIGGKTGTTNNAISTWFSGFHNDLVTTVWVGTDDFSSLGKNEYGSSIALPTWVDFMKVALTDLPEENWDIPDGLSYVKVDSDSGQPANKNTRNSYFELFFEEID